MSDILTSLLQGLFDYWTHLLSFLRKHLDYSSLVRSAKELNSNQGTIILENVIIPDRTIICILQFVQSKGRWELLFLDKRNKYIGNSWLETSAMPFLPSLDSSKVYAIRLNIPIE